MAQGESPWFTDARIDALRYLVADYDGLLYDHDHCSQQQIVYAVDFSELYSYVYINATVQNITYSPDATPLKKIAFNEMLLDEILFSAHYKLVILPPHQLELRKFVEGFPDRLAADHITAVSSAPEWSDWWLEFFKRFYRNEQEVPELNEQMRERFLNEMCSKAPELFLFARRQEYAPENRLRTLLNHSEIFSTFDSLGISNALLKEISTHVFDAAFDKFSAERPERSNSNRVDAYAIAQLVMLNEEYGDRLQFRLVTRSTVLPTVLASLQNDISADYNIGKLSRRPQQFATTRLARSMDQSLVKLVRERREASGVMLRAAEYARRRPHRQGNKRSLNQRPTDALAALHTRFEELEATSLIDSLHDNTPQHPAYSDPIEKYTDVRALIHYSLSTTAMQNAVRERLKEHVERINSQTIDLASWFSVNEEALGGSLEHEMYKDGARSSNQLLYPYPITTYTADTPRTALRILFYSRSIENSLVLGRTARETLEHFIVQQGNSAYERRLAVALLQAALGWWALTLDFAKLATKAPADAADIPRHEAFYLMAVARRMSATSTVLERIASCVNDLFVAQELLHSYQQQAECADARYLIEYGILLRHAERAAIHVPEDVYRFGISTPLSAWDEALRLADNDIYVQMLALNSLCYYEVEEGGLDTLNPALNRLLDSLRALQIEIENAPIVVQHTIFTAYKRLERWNSKSEREALLKRIADLESDIFGEGHW